MDDFIIIIIIVLHVCNTRETLCFLRFALALNCGGLSRKRDRLVTLLVYAEADIVCLQEAGRVTESDVAGLGYRFVAGGVWRCGGLVTLLHNRFVRAGGQLRGVAPRHGYLGVCTTGICGAGVAVAHLPLPPSLAPETRRDVCVEALDAVHGGVKCVR